MGVSSRPPAFRFLIFFNSASSSSSVNCPSLTSCWSLMTFWQVCQWFQEDFRADTSNVLSTLQVFLFGRQLLVLAFDVPFLPWVHLMETQDSSTYHWSIIRRCISTIFVYLDYVLQMLIGWIKENSFTLKKKGKKQTISSRNYNRCRRPKTSCKITSLSRLPTS